MDWLLLKNSLLVSAQTMFCSLIIGFLAALWAAGLEKRWRNLIFILAIIAFALPPFLVTNCWLHYLGNAGVWRKWLPFNIISLGGTVWILTLLTWPVSFFLVFAALQKIERVYFEAEPLLGGFAMIRWLLWPMAKNEILLAAVLTFILALNNFAVPVILQTRIFPEEVWLSFNTTFDYAAALKLSWPLVIAPLILLFLFRKQNVSWLWKNESIPAKMFRRQLGERWFLSGAIGGTAILIFSVALPMAQLGLARQTWNDLTPALAAGKNAIWFSFIFAATTACLVILFSLWTSRWRFGLATWILFLIPGMLLGIALIRLLNRPPFTAFYQSVGIVVLAFAIRYFAPGWNAFVHALRGTDKNLNDMAEMEGAGRWQVFWRVQLRQVFPQLCAAWYVVYIFCLWDVETLVFIVPPGVETVSLRIFNLLHYGHNSQVNALCLALLVLAILPLLIYEAGRAASRVFGKKQSLGSSGASPSRVGLVLLALLFFAGCSASDGKNSRNQFPIESKLFSHVEIIGSRGTAPGQFNKPRSLALDEDDNLFVVDMTGRVQKFSSNGVYLSSWQMPQTDLGKPKGMSRDKDGNIIVVEPHYQRLNHFSSDGKQVAQWGAKGTNDGELVLPRSVAVNSRGEIFVSEYTTVDRVQAFSSAGKWLFTFGKAGEGEGEFNRPEGLGIDGQNRIFVADSCNHRIHIFSADGKFIRRFGRAGSGRGELSYPYDVRIDAEGLQYVCEFGNSRIQIFDVNHQSLDILGRPGGGPGEFANPWSIAFDSKGNLYVADSQNHRVQKFVRKRASSTVNIPRSTSKLARGNSPGRRKLNVECWLSPISQFK